MNDIRSMSDVRSLRSCVLLLTQCRGVCQIIAMSKVMAKFGIAEIARTGRISLKRGEELLERSAGWSKPAVSSDPAAARWGMRIRMLASVWWID
jgi:Small subunit of acetolactate synthase